MRAGRLVERLLRWAPWILLGAAILLLVVGLLPDDACARVGGGEGFSTGGSRGGGGGRSSGGGGDGGEADLIFLLIWLAIEHPTIGVPLLLIAVVFIVVRAMMKGGGSRRRPYPDEVDPWVAPTAPHRGDRADVAALRKADPGFSMPVLLDYLQLVHRRATEAATTDRWEPLAPFVADGARAELQAAHRGVREVRDVVVGGLTLDGMERVGDRFVLTVTFRDSRRETLDGGEERRVYVEESWRFARHAAARTQEPEAVMRMGCPSCGAAIDTDRAGQCRSCGTPIVQGLLEWRAESVALHFRRPIQAPAVGPAAGGVEESALAPTVIDPHLGRAWREFRARHPGFEPNGFLARSKTIFLSLQQAWSDGKWADARPYVTDPLFQTLRFQVEQYAEHGLRNKLADVEVLKQEIVKVEVDAWYEAITLRLYGSAKDWVEDGSGKVVGGNRTRDRQFSEYWTFLRAIGTGDTVHDAHACPSCGAPLDRVSQAGVCGYCDSKITTGRFDWVLARIDQPQVYRG